MFKIVHLDGTQKIPDDEICYILSKEGIHIKKKIGLIDCITPVKNISILESLTTYAKMDIPKIPGDLFGKICKFFKDVYEKFRGEAVVVLYYSTKNKRYKVYVPKQEVTGASVKYNLEHPSFKDYQQVGTIHSHANFSAFHSGVDDKDEEHFDGIHITIGNVVDENPSISASIVANGTRFPVSPIDYIDKLEIREFTKVFPNMFKPKFTEINGIKIYEKDVKSTLAYILDVPDELRNYNSEWINAVSKPEIKTIDKTNLLGRQNYANLFTSNYQHPRIRGLSEDSLLINETSCHNRDDKCYHPCSGCLFRDYKIDMSEVKEISDDETSYNKKTEVDDYYYPEWWNKYF